MVEKDNYKLGSYYVSKNNNGSLFIFKVVEKSELCITLNVIVDKDDIAYRIDKGEVIYLYEDDTKETLAGCFLNITEVSKSEILAVVL